MTDASEPEPSPPMVPPPDALPPPVPEPLISAPEETQVEFHKPKPIHSWREFLTEIGVVVIGVGIALAGEQAVEWWHWRGEVAHARELIATEMAQNMVGAITRLRTQPCIERRLDELTDILEAASSSGQLPAVGNIGQPPPKLWRKGAWDSLVAAETATHFPRQQLAELGSIYQLVERMEGNTSINTQAWSELYTMVGPGRRLDPASEARLRNALSLARAVNRTYASMSMTLMDRTRPMNLPFNGEDLKQIDEAEHLSLMAAVPGATPDATSAICGPLGAVPQRYGQSQFSLIPGLADHALKTLPDFGAP